MFRIEFKPQALTDLKRIKRHHAPAIVDATERHLAEEPERITRGSIRRLRGQQQTTFRLRVGEYRVFYDVREARVESVRIFHKAETRTFYKEKP
jgi:mRNA-degrading endonuclease RelE of RelBE toxin-antitoxin system